MKRILLVLFLVVLLAGAGGYIYLKSRGYSYVITQAQIDQELAKRFPASKSYLKILELTYSNPEATLLNEPERVRVALDATLDIRVKSLAKQLRGSAALTARVDYRPETQEFHLDDVQFEKLTIDGVPPEYLEIVTALASKAAHEYVQRTPIYRLQATDLKSSVTKAFLKDVQFRDREIVVLIGL